MPEELTENAKNFTRAIDSLFEGFGKAMEDIVIQEHQDIEEELEQAKIDGLGRVIIIQKTIIKHKNKDVSFQSNIRIGKTDKTKAITLTYLPPETREEE